MDAVIPLSPAAASATRHAPRTAEPVPALLDDPYGAFARNVERASFLFDHGLGHHPLFRIPQLIELARRQPQLPGYNYWSANVRSVGDKWSEGDGDAADALRAVENNNAMVQFCHVEHDPVIGPLIRELMQAIVERSGARMATDVRETAATLLIASPRRLTHYHIDAASGFLIQIAGSGKVLSVHDRDDRRAITEEELERFYAGDYNGTAFHEDHAQAASHHHVDAGHGVHIPAVAPHWARNGDDVSIALSLSYHLHSAERRAKIYQANHRLRRWGLKPVPPGVSAWRDSAKLAAKSALAGVRTLTGRTTAKPSGNAMT
ncbi:MAG TPA: hypothetical protein VM369_09330 [Candidatus Binatia bacterium]|nr:hypothetical protein [Candidatus Binatia bacterium]